MDGWGVAGCREHRDKIIGWLNDARAGTRFTAVLRAAHRARRLGLINWGSLRDPAGSLLDEALRRADAGEPIAPH